jgi:hypothetical protein
MCFRDVWFVIKHWSRYKGHLKVEEWVEVAVEFDCGKYVQSELKLFNLQYH